MIEIGLLQMDFDLRNKLRLAREIMQRYRDRPMSFADAALVRIALIEQAGREVRG